MIDLDWGAKKAPHRKARRKLRKIDGLRCWHVGTGGAVGSSFSLALGQKVKRRVSLRNCRVSPDYREYRGTGTLVVWCAWRLEDVEGRCWSWEDPEQADGLQRLVGKRVAGLRLFEPAWDLVITFTGGFSLRVFCDHTEADGFDGNWEAVVDDVEVAAGPGSRLTVKPVALQP